MLTWRCTLPRRSGTDRQPSLISTSSSSIGSITGLIDDRQRDRRLVRVARVVRHLDHGDAHALADLVGGEPGTVGLRASCRSGRRSDPAARRPATSSGSTSAATLAQHRMADRDRISRTRHWHERVRVTAPQHREQRVVHRRAGGELVDEAGERRRGGPPARGVHHVVAEEAHRQHTPAIRAGRRRPAACSVSMWKNTASPGSSAQPRTRKRSGSASIVGQLGERAVGEPLGLVVEERARHVPGPAVGAGDELAASTERRPDRRGTTCWRSAGRRRCSTAGPGATACAGWCRAP